MSAEKPTPPGAETESRGSDKKEPTDQEKIQTVINNLVVLNGDRSRLTKEEILKELEKSGIEADGITIEEKTLPAEKPGETSGDVWQTVVALVSVTNRGQEIFKGEVTLEEFTVS